MRFQTFFERSSSSSANSNSAAALIDCSAVSVCAFFSAAFRSSLASSRLPLECCRGYYVVNRIRAIIASTQKS